MKLMNRLSLAVCFLVAVAPISWAKESTLPRVAQCRGVSAAEVFDLVSRATEDPAKRFAKRPVPRVVACASQVWKTRRSNSAAVSRPMGTFRGQDDLPVAIDTAPSDLPPQASAHAVRTRPLREMHPIPPPKRGDDNDGGHPEPIRPDPLPDGGPDQSAHQTVPGPVVSAPTGTGLGWDGVGVGL
ncbi:MAG TPA: hypothetical protein VGJ82_15160, partial [Thermoanaerobaculia bacterium]